MGLFQTFKTKVIQDIKRDIASSTKTMTQIAAEYGISMTALHKIAEELETETGFRRKAGRPRKVA